jgi:hypothetical protein
MNHIVRGAALAALFIVAGTSGAQAQEAVESRKFFSVGAGATVPFGDFKEEAKTGFLTGLGFGSGIGSGNLFLLGTGFYGKNNVAEGEDDDHGQDEHGEDTFSLLGGSVNLGLMGSGEAVRPYGYVGLGMQRVEQKGEDHSDGAENEAFGNAVVGLSIGRGNTRFWIQGGAVLGGEHTYIPISAGVSIGF